MLTVIAMGAASVSPRWAQVGSAVLYFYAEEPHRRPHVAVLGPDWSVTIALDNFELLSRTGRPPRATLRRVVRLLRTNQGLAVEAFERTRLHRFPGTLEEQLEDRDG